MSFSINYTKKFNRYKNETLSNSAYEDWIAKRDGYPSVLFQYHEHIFGNTCEHLIYLPDVEDDHFHMGTFYYLNNGDYDRTEASGRVYTNVHTKVAFIEKVVFQYESTFPESDEYIEGSDVTCFAKFQWREDILSALGKMLGPDWVVNIADFDTDNSGARFFNRDDMNMMAELMEENAGIPADMPGCKVFPWGQVIALYHPSFECFPIDDY